MDFDLARIQSALRDFDLEGWLLYDFRGNNPLARRVLDLPDDQIGSRRCAYGIPREGSPLKIVHRIEDSVLDHLPGEKRVYLRWQEFEAALKEFTRGRKRVAMEYSPLGGNPYVGRVDAGTVELVSRGGVEVVSSGDLISLFEATWDEEQWRLHQQASAVTHEAFAVAWRLIANSIRAKQPVDETGVQEAIMAHFEASGATTYHPPIVARNEHSGLPHYETGTGSDCRIRRGDFILIDLWAKMNVARSVYSDLTRVGFVGEEVPPRYEKTFRIVAAARDAGIDTVRQAFDAGRPLRGAEVDVAVRQVIEQAGYGEYFVHRTGHSIGQEVHGNGAHLDHLETRDDRQILPATCFSIEPGIYLPEFGIRSEVDVFVDADNGVHVTGGLIQQEVIPILRDY